MRGLFSSFHRLRNPSTQTRRRSSWSFRGECWGIFIRFLIRHGISWRVFLSQTQNEVTLSTKAWRAAVALNVSNRIDKLIPPTWKFIFARCANGNDNEIRMAKNVSRREATRRERGIIKTHWREISFRMLKEQNASVNKSSIKETRRAEFDALFRSGWMRKNATSLQLDESSSWGIKIAKPRVSLFCWIRAPVTRWRQRTSLTRVPLSLRYRQDNRESTR